MNFRVTLPAKSLPALTALTFVALTLPMGAQVTGNTTTTTDANGTPQTSVTMSAPIGKKKKKAPKEDKVVLSKDTKKSARKDAKLSPLAGKDVNLPDKALYDKALEQTRKGHFDVARLDLQTLLNTYPDSQYQMRAKLAIADSWYKEGGSAALTQAEQEYVDFITFFPNVPEAAEAQKRVGDIYFKQMDVPDRDYQKALKAQDAYRLMLKQYPDSALIGEVKQELREVQEILATREAELGAFYSTHENWPASIARYQTVADTYPQYSRMDDTLIAIGDGYAAESRVVRAQAVCSPSLPANTPCIPEAARAKVLSSYDGKAADAYRKVVLEHSAAPHVEDAKERLESMGLPIPTPTAEQMAASEELEGSRAQYTLSKRLLVLLMHKPDTVIAARAGDPPLEDPAATTAPTISNDLKNAYMVALGAPPAPAPKTAAGDTTSDASAPAAVPTPAGPLSLQDVPGPGEGSSPNSGTTTMTQGTPASSAPGGASLGVEVLTPGVNAGSTAPRGVDTTPDPVTGLRAVGPSNATALPPVEKAEPAPDTINEVLGKPQPAAQEKDPNKKKNPKPAFDKEDESSSRHKKKKGVDKINPF